MNSFCYYIIVAFSKSWNSLDEDVIQMSHKVLQIQVNQSDLNACQFSKSYNSTADPLPVRFKVVNFWKKDVVCAQKYRLKNYWSKINSKPVYFRERVSKWECDLIGYMDGLGPVTSTNNCVPQVMVKTATGSRTHNVVNEFDPDNFGSNWKNCRQK